MQITEKFGLQINNAKITGKVLSDAMPSLKNSSPVTLGLWASLLFSVFLAGAGSLHAQTTPNQLIVDVPAGTNNSAGAGSKTCTIPGFLRRGLVNRRCDR